MPRWIAIMGMCAALALPAQVPVALLSGGLGEDCLLYRAGREAEACLAPRLLYPGDELRKASGVSTLRIRWFAPPATHGVRKGRTHLRVAFRVPKDASALLPLARRAFPEASRAAQEALMELRSSKTRSLKAWTPLPDYRVALLPGRKVPFPTPGLDGRILVLDEHGEKVFERTFGTAPLELSPEDMGLQAGQTYFWAMEGASTQRGRMRLVEPALAMRIEADLRALDPVRNPVLAAFYLRMENGVHDMGDLNWLSEPWLSSAGSALGKELKAAIR